MDNVLSFLTHRWLEKLMHPRTGHQIFGVFFKLCPNCAPSSFYNVLKTNLAKCQVDNFYLCFQLIPCTIESWIDCVEPLFYTETENEAKLYKDLLDCLTRQFLVERIFYSPKRYDTERSPIRLSNFVQTLWTFCLTAVEKTFYAPDHDNLLLSFLLDILRSILHCGPVEAFPDMLMEQLACLW